MSTGNAGSTGNTATETTLLVGGRIYSPSSPDATAMAVSNGVVVWLGADRAGRGLYPDAAIVDLDGAFVAPGFVDAHVHATATGLSLLGPTLTDVRDAPELLSVVREATQQDRVLLAHGWDETTWPSPRIPSRAEIDEAADGALVYLGRIDGHSALISSGLAARYPELKELPGWSADGPLSGEANKYLHRVEGELITPERRRQAQETFLRVAAARGIVTVHECGGPSTGADDMRELLELGARAANPAVVGYWGELNAIETATRLGVRGLAGDLLVDGAFGSRTAALHEPYTDQPGVRGTKYLEADTIAEHVIGCTKAGLQAGFHVIGDSAMTAVIDGFHKAEKVLGRRALTAAHHRLEHVEMISEPEIASLANWGVFASVQPQFDATWGGREGMYAARLGAERVATMNPFATFAAAGVVLAFGSDSPVTGLNPWASIRAAVRHRTPGLGISARAAFNAHTKGGHRASGITDGITGTLTPGAPAHYAVWEVDELVTPTSDSRVQRWSTDPRSRVPALPNMDPVASLPRCLRTVRAGNTIYDATNDHG